MEQNENTLTVLEIVPGQYPKQVEIDPDLKSLQQAVGGNIGASYPFSDPVAIVYNDEGKLMGLPLNRALRDESGEAYDVVAGTFLVVGLGEEDFAWRFCVPMPDRGLILSPLSMRGLLSGRWKSVVSRRISET